ncbi:hypothetical protein D3C71_1271020 [compost metagenome]
MSLHGPLGHSMESVYSSNGANPGVGLRLARRERATTSSGSRWARAFSSIPTVSSEISPQISPCACRAISEGNRSETSRLMRDSGTPPAMLAAIALNGRKASGAAPENGPRGVKRPVEEDMMEIALMRGVMRRWNSVNIIQSATPGHCRRCPSASGCGTITLRPIFLPPYKL